MELEGNESSAAPSAALSQQSRARGRARARRCIWADGTTRRHRTVEVTVGPYYSMSGVGIDEQRFQYTHTHTHTLSAASICCADCKAT